VTILCASRKKEDLAGPGFNSRSVETFDVSGLSSALEPQGVKLATGIALGPCLGHPPETYELNDDNHSLDLITEKWTLQSSLID
jgi:hypothetical protein